MPKVDHTKRNDLTLAEWLNGADLPEGFRDWDGAYRHWDQWSSIGWAISCFLNEAKKKREYCVSNNQPKKKRIIPLLEELVALAELAGLTICSEDPAAVWGGIPSIIVKLPNSDTARIILNEYGEFWSTAMIPGLPCQMIRSWPNVAVRIYLGKDDQVKPSNAEELRTLASTFNLDIVFITSDPKEFPDEHYMLVHVPEHDGAKASIFHGVDGCFYSNREIPGIPMIKMPWQSKTKKFQIQI